MADLIDPEQLTEYKKAFNKFDKEATETISTKDINFVMKALGFTFNAGEVKEMQKEADPEGTGKITFDDFCLVIAKWVLGSDDNMDEELKNAFRLYDKGGNGYINVEDLGEMLSCLDDNLSEDDLKNMIKEIDTDGSGTVDFEEFMEVFNG